MMGAAKTMSIGEVWDKLDNMKMEQAEHEKALLKRIEKLEREVRILNTLHRRMK